MVPDAAIAAILRAELDPEAACTKLVAQANDAGGRDNITVLIVPVRRGRSQLRRCVAFTARSHPRRHGSVDRLERRSGSAQGVSAARAPAVARIPSVDSARSAARRRIRTRWRATTPDARPQYRQTTTVVLRCSFGHGALDEVCGASGQNVVTVPRSSQAD